MTDRAAALARADAVTFDCFGTLLTADRPADPAAAVGRALADRGVTLPDDWTDVYGQHHLEPAPGEAFALDRHVRAALAARDVSCSPATARAAVLAAFDRPVERCAGAGALLADLRDRPVGVVSNCAVPGLVPRVLAETGLADQVDAVVTSVATGWRKPDDRPFRRAADRLDVALDSLVHVGDDAEADGGADRAGATAIVIEGGTLRPLRTELAEAAWE